MNENEWKIIESRMFWGAQMRKEEFFQQAGERDWRKIEFEIAFRITMPAKNDPLPMVK